MSNFDLSEKLRLFLQLATGFDYHYIGIKCPVSIRRRYAFSQRLVIYPENEYDFFTSWEIATTLELVNALGLTVMVSGENGLPILEVTDYYKNR